MKRIALVAAVAALSLVGCKKSEEKKAEPAAATDTAATDTAAKPAEPTTPPATPAADPAAATAPAADPAAPSADDLMVGIAECDDVVKRYLACEKMPAEAKAAFIEGAKARKQAAANLDDAGKKQMADACKAAAPGSEQGLKAAGC